MNKIFHIIFKKRKLLLVALVFSLLSLSIVPKATFAEGNPFVPTTDTLNTGLTPQVGGQDLDIAAQTLANMTDVSGAYYDSATNRIVFVGKTGGVGPQFNKDDMAVAIKSIFFNNTMPNINIADDPNNPSSSSALVTYTGGIQNTSLGNVLFNADYKLKQYVIGYAPNNTQITSSVSTYKSVVDRYIQLNPNPINGNQTKFILTPQAVSMKTSANAFVFDSVTMQATTQIVNSGNDPLWNQAATSFASDITTNYNSYAQEVPAFEQAKQLGKIVAILKWISDKSVPTDFQWARDYIPQTVSTPTSVQKVASPLLSGYSAQGEINYNTPNSYLPDDGSAAGLKSSSQGVSNSSEDVTWTFTNGGQQYQAVAVASTAFKSLGAYNTSVSDFSIPIEGDLKIGFERKYSSFSNAQSGIGIGWDMMPARVYPNASPDSINLTICNSVIYFTKLAIDTPNGHETFTYTCPSGDSADQASYHTKLIQNSNGTVTLTSSDQTKYQFNDDLQLISIQDKNNNAINYSYDTNGKLTGIADTKNHNLTVTYNSQNLISKVQDWANQSVQYTYDSSGKLTGVIDPRGNTTSYGYDSNSRLSTVTDREGQLILTNTYSSDARISTQKNPSNLTKTFAYDNVNKLVTQTDNNGRLTKTTYDSNARILQQTDPANKSITYTYGTEAVPLSDTDRNGKQTTYTYDSAGNVTTVTFPDGKIATYTYDAKNRLTMIVDGRYGSPGKQTDYVYDSTGNQTQRTEAGLVSIYTYNTAGEMLTYKDPLNNTTTWTVDTLGNILTETDAYSKVTTSEYDLVGHKTKLTDSSSKIFTYTYDANGNPITITDAYGSVINTYDKENRIKQAISPTNAITQYNYNSSGSMTSVIDALNNTTTYGYDTYQNLTTQQDALNRITTNVFNTLDRQSSSSTPLGNATSWQYDGNGNITQRTDANNKTTTYLYDAFNRLTKITYPDTTTITYTYDNRGNLITMVDPVGTSSYIYDNFDRMTKATNAYGKIVEYTYDALDNILTIKYPDGKMVTYTYDKNNRMLSVKDWNNKLISYTYNNNGTLATRTYPNTISSTYTYDNANRLSSLEHKKGAVSGAKWTYQRDAMGNVTIATPSGSFFSSPSLTSYSYDKLGRVINSVSNDREGDHSYTYDKVGNIVSKTDTLSTRPMTYDNDNKLTSIIDSTFGTFNQTYDSNGNLTTKKDTNETRPLTYDFENRLINFRESPTSSYNRTFKYDGLGNRVQQTYANLSTTRYINDNNGPLSRVLATTDQNNNIGNWNLYGLGILSEGGSTDNNRKYYLEDGLGNVRFTTSSTGSAGPANYYDPYGQVTWQSGSIPTYLYKSEDLDDTGFLFLRGRYYDPTIGRFITKDPVAGYINNPLSQNSYIYGYDNPVNMHDPSGRDATDIYTVYISQNAEGVINYIGITNDLPRRQREHYGPKGKGITIQRIDGLDKLKLTKAQARQIEQFLININGGPSKNGSGSLLNRINSISSSRANYKDAVAAGKSIIQQTPSAVKFLTFLGLGALLAGP